MEKEDKQDMTETSNVSMLLLYYRFQFAEDIAMRRVMGNLRAQGDSPFLHYRTKQRHSEQMRLCKRMLQLCCQGVDDVTERVRSMEQGYDTNRGVANAIARMGLAMMDRFGDDYKRMQEFVDEFLEQTGGKESLSSLRPDDLDWFVMK